jgi:ATP-dependent Lon protease
MKESIECAKTIAWNLIPDTIKKKIKKEWKDNGNYGIHIHCPEASTPKEGPSAGCAITLAFVSLFTNIPVKNTIALTGEIDLNGMAREIGGLDIKIDGGKLAGVQTILYPSQNQEDINIIKQETPEILENIEIHPIETIYDVLEYCLEENDITFN